VGVRDTARAYTIDSVALNFTLAARDTALNGLQVQVYRLPRSIDSNTTYAGIAPAFDSPGALIATIEVPDSVNGGTIRAVFHAAELSRVEIPASDSGQLAVGLRIAAPPATGIRVGAIASGTAALFTSYVTLDIPDTGTAKLRTLVQGASFNTYVSEVPQVIDSLMLTVGGAPSSRALLRFSLPPRIRDSATVVRATLELTPVASITGLSSDPARIFARALLADVGAKSPASSAATRVPEDTLEIGANSVSIEAVRLVELWLGETTRPSALVLSLTPEAGSFTRPAFHSSRAADPALRPRLRLSYLLSFPFETP
jgi:hypothetical protein